MNRQLLLGVLLLLSAAASADYADVQQRIQTVAREAAALNASREAEFSAAIAGSRLAAAAALEADAELQRRISVLEAAIAEQDAALADLETAIRGAALSTTTLTAAVRQAGGELAARLRRSPVAAEFPGRDAALDTLAASPGMPSITDLENAWRVLADELQRSGEFSQFDAEGIDAPVLRAGSLALLTPDAYLSWSGGNMSRIAARPARSAGEYFILHFDPTRDHALLRRLDDRTPVRDLVRAAGPVGFVIIGLALAAIPILLLRALRLLNARKGREAAEIERGRLALRLIATAAPLLGLLGTIAGMITAFRGLNLFGQGDAVLVADSIGKALLTTAMGLIVAVPVFFLAVVLERMQADIERDYETEGHAS